MGGKEDKFDKFDEMGQLPGGYDEDIARQKALEHAMGHLSEDEDWLQGVPLAWEVESAKFEEDENCYKVILLCYPKGIEPESKTKWEYHIDATGKLKPGTPILHTRGKWTAESGRIQDEQQRREDEQRRVEEEKRRKEQEEAKRKKREQQEAERKRAVEEKRRPEEAERKRVDEVKRQAEERQRKEQEEAEARKRAEEEKVNPAIFIVVFVLGAALIIASVVRLMA